jgi:hypothetical protein
MSGHVGRSVVPESTVNVHNIIALSTMVRSLSSRSLSKRSVLLVFEEKEEDPPMKAQYKNKERRSKKQRKNGPPLDLLPKHFDRMKRGVWFRVLPAEDTFDDMHLRCYESGWDDLLPLLIDHGLLACDICDNIKNYKFITKRDT